MNIIKKYRIIAIGVFLIVGGGISYSIGLEQVNATYLCLHPRENAFPPGTGYFFPGSTFTSICPVSQDIGQDLVFVAKFYEWDAEEIPIPAHVKITDPNGNVMVNSNYELKKVIVYVKPTVFGNYTATITSLEDSENRTTKRPDIYYAFGFISPFTSPLYEGVSNPLGTTFQLMTAIGGSSILPGIILVIVGLVKASRKESA